MNPTLLMFLVLAIIFGIIHGLSQCMSNVSVPNSKNLLTFLLGE